MSQPVVPVDHQALLADQEAGSLEMLMRAFNLNLLLQFVEIAGLAESVDPMVPVAKLLLSERGDASMLMNTVLTVLLRRLQETSPMMLNNIELRVWGVLPKPPS